MFAFRCIACGEAFHQPLQPYASSDYSLRHKAWLHMCRGITAIRLLGWSAMRALSLVRKTPIALVACLSNDSALKARLAAFSPCSATTLTAASVGLSGGSKALSLDEGHCCCYLRSHRNRQHSSLDHDGLTKFTPAGLSTRTSHSQPASRSRDVFSRRSKL